MSWANDAIDAVRKASIRDAKKDASEEKKYKVVKKGSAKNLKYTLLKNPENPTKNQQATMKMLIKSDKRLYRAYLLKEGLKLCFRYSCDEAINELDKWLEEGATMSDQGICRAWEKDKKT